MNPPVTRNAAESPPYLRIWRWHFFAGLCLSPTLAILAVTGLIYLFKPQVEPALYRKWLNVTATPSQISAQAQLESALKAFPGAQVQYVIPSPSPDRTMQVFFKTKSLEPVTIYVNPNDGAITGQQRSDRTLMALAHDLHGSILLGKPGEILMELTAGWTYILVATGLFLWWPPAGSRGAGVLWPRLWLKGRALIRDIHAVPVFYLSGLIFLFLSTGIPWTGITGKWISKTATAHGVGSPPGFMGSPFQSEPANGRTALPLDALVAISRERIPEANADILLPKNPGGAAVIRWKAPRPQDRAYVHVDVYSGNVIADYRWKDFGFVGKITLMSVALHEGTWFGAWNQALNSAVAVGVLGLIVTGLWMWWMRRPSGALLAAPQPLGGTPLPASFWILIALFSAIVPVAGVSLLAILALDFAASRLARLMSK